MSQAPGVMRARSAGQSDGFLQGFRAAADEGHAPALLGKFRAMARPTPLPGAGDDGGLVHASSRFPALRIAQFHPLPRLGRVHRGIHHRLRAGAVVEAGGAGPLAADGVHEFPGLVVAERHQRIALRRIARGAGPGPELARHFDRLQARAAGLAGLELVPLAGDEDERALAAVDLHGIEAAPAFVAAAGQLAAFQHAAWRRCGTRPGWPPNRRVSLGWPPRTGCHCFKFATSRCIGPTSRWAKSMRWLSMSPSSPVPASFLTWRQPRLRVPQSCKRQER